MDGFSPSPWNGTSHEGYLIRRLDVPGFDRTPQHFLEPLREILQRVSPFHRKDIFECTKDVRLLVTGLYNTFGVC